MSSDCSNLDGLFRSILSTLIEVTFHSQSLHYCFFTATIQNSYNEWEVSFSQLVWLIKSTDYVEKIDDFMIKSIKQHLFIMTDFSQHASFWLLFSETTVSTAVKASSIHRNAACIQLQHDKAIDVKALALQESKLFSNNDNCGLSNSNSDFSDNNDRCSSKKKQRHLHISKHSQWSDLDKQHLLTYKKESKSWEWIFDKFSDRTQPAICMHWNMIWLRDN